MDWFLYYRDLCHVRVKYAFHDICFFLHPLTGSSFLMFPGGIEIEISGMKGVNSNCNVPRHLDNLLGTIILIFLLCILLKLLKFYQRKVSFFCARSLKFNSRWHFYLTPTSISGKNSFTNFEEITCLVFYLFIRFSRKSGI